MLAAPLMGMPKMPIGDMLGNFLHIGSPAGWVMHAMMGVVLALICAGAVAGRGSAVEGAQERLLADARMTRARLVEERIRVGT